MKYQRFRIGLLFAAAFLTAVAAAAQNPVTDWNTIASTTIVFNAGKGPAPSFVWLAYSSIAVYDAVNAVDGGHQPFYYAGKAAPGASEEAAAIQPATLFNSLGINHDLQSQNMEVIYESCEMDLGNCIALIGAAGFQRHR